MSDGDLPRELVDPAFHAWFSGLRPHLADAARQVARELAALAVTPAVELEAWRKAARGWAEHDGQIIHMTDEQIAEEERSEVLDLIVYRAARLAV